MFDVKPGAENSRRGRLARGQKRSFAFATFEDRVAAPEQAVGFEGPWAWLKLVDAAKDGSAQAQADSDLVSVLRFNTKHHRALVTIEASNASSNPFAGT